MVYTAVDCQGFAGGFTLGVAQAGFKLVGKREMKGGFGVANCEANRHLLGDAWQSEAVDHTEWTIPHGGADLVFGNPPCSGFSVLSTKSFRGSDSKINECMWAFVDYVARVRPQVAVFESVQLAYTQGGDLMRALRADLEAKTGESWTLHHVLHNALSVGGPAMRKRYFWVASRVPFGIERPELVEVPLLDDVIGDLRDMDQAWTPLPYRRKPSWYSVQFRNTNRHVDGHISIDNPNTRRTRELLNSVEWNPGEHAQVVTRRYFDQHGDLPPSWHHLVDKLKGNDFFQGFSSPTMWRPDQHARVITGAGLLNGVHWVEKRTFTHREAARILGFPDSWLIEPLRKVPSLFLTWGKGISVHCGRWIAEWVHRALDGEPGSVAGELIGEREYLVDVTHSWKDDYGTVKASAQLMNALRTVFDREEIPVTEPGPETPVAEGTETTPTATNGAVRGRPRPSETVERDRRVLDYLAEPLTKTVLAERLTTDGVIGDPKHVYLSLWRLRRDGKVRRERRDGAHVWLRAEQSEPAA